MTLTTKEIVITHCNNCEWKPDRQHGKLDISNQAYNHSHYFGHTVFFKVITIIKGIKP
jgi:hypothetical protein